MSREPIPVALETARRLAVTKQRLAGARPPRATSRSIRSVVRDLAYVQWDPVTIVAPSHLLSLWARLDAFRPSHLERLLWTEKTVFENWLPFAALVLTDDYPLYRSLMRRYPGSLSSSWGAQRDHARRFLSTHASLRTTILRELRGGPRTLGEFEDHGRTKRNEGEWNFGSDVAQMLYHLTMTGAVMVVGHRGNQNLWGRTEDFLPSGVDRTALPAEEFERSAAERAIRALGTASPKEINHYFVRGRYLDLPAALAGLEAESRIRRVRVDGLGPRDERYIHEADLPLLDTLTGDGWQPRLSLLPPFDNLVCGTDRTKRLFGFDYVREQFLPPAKRRFGTYVLPILYGDRFIGRIDPKLDPVHRRLEIQAVHAEPGVREEEGVAKRIDAAVRSLADFVGADSVGYPGRVPEIWKDALR